MDRDKLQKYFFFGVFFVITALTIAIFLPFLRVLVLAGILAVVIHPFYEKVLQLTKGKQRISAILVIVIASIIIIIPTVFLSINIFGETQGLYFELQGNKVEYVERVTRLVEKPIQAVYPSFTLDLHKYSSLAANWIVSNLDNFFTSAAHIVINVLLATVSVFFFLKDGAKFKRVFMRLSPLDDKYDQQIFTKIEKTITSVMRGTILIALLQGLLVGIGLTIFGIPNVILWGSVAAICALVPGLGTSLVIIPAVAYLFFTGNPVYAVGLLIWGFVIVGLIDNILAPYLYSQGVKIHPLATLFSVLGGLVLFGPIGFIFGPIILTLFLLLVGIYQELIVEGKEHKV